jgi:hypothetical protein
VGEIKSTLDLVMEKTRNLKMSSEEKQEQKAKESERRIKGLLQKLQDGLLTEDQLITEYENLKKTAALTDDSLLIEEIVTRLDPHHDTRSLMGILKKCCHQDTTGIETIIDDYRDTFHQASRKRIKQIKEDFAHKHSITGSAVVPNLDIDEDWQQEAHALRIQLKNRLRKEMKLP